MTANQAISYRRHRFSPEVISQCVWLYFRFPLSFRDVEELMAARGVVVSYETIRTWCGKFGRQYARIIRSTHGAFGDRWHLDEVYLRIRGELAYLWRAVDQEGQVLGILVQPRRDGSAAHRFIKKILRHATNAPRSVVTDKLAAYNRPCARLLPDAKHIRDKGMNNRAENSHQPTRLREQRMHRFKPAAQAQRFLSIFSEIRNLFNLSRHAVTASNFRALLRQRQALWSTLTCTRLP